MRIQVEFSESAIISDKHCISSSDIRYLHPAGGLVLQDAPATDAAGLLLWHLSLARGHGGLLLPEGNT